MLFTDKCIHFLFFISLVRISVQKQLLIKTQVKVDQGILEGRTKVTQSGFHYNVFLQIPYAKPPVGDLRFKDPQPADAWDDIRDASVKADICPQVGYIFTNLYKGNEDCLYLNVFTPGKEIDSSAKLPVMFWVHGGGFELGDGNPDVYGPEYIIEHNVIFVSINYRLGPLGFLSLNIPEVPGNAGLKDQVMALKWVSKNIHYFGGDPKNVTIFGQSAGGVSVSLLMLSPLARGLFSKVIAQSGTAVNDWSIHNNPDKLMNEYVKTLGLQSSDKYEMLNHLRNVSAQKLILASKLPEVSHGKFLVFLPIIENIFPNTSNFITEQPREIMERGDFTKVPYLTGFLSQEGLLSVLLYPSVILSGRKFVDDVIPDFQEFVPKHLLYNSSTDRKSLLVNKIKEFYFQSQDNITEEIFDLITDSLFARDIDFTVKQLVKHNAPTYYYTFSYKGRLNIMQYVIPYSYTEACHGDELVYIFKFNIPGAFLIIPNQRDILMRKQMTELWTNFAKTGNPTPAITQNIPLTWKPATPEEINYLLINNEPVMEMNPIAQRIKFWEDLEDI